MAFAPLTDRTTARLACVLAVSLAMACAAGLLVHPAAAQPITAVKTLPAGARIIDPRALNTCEHRTLPEARCLPAQSLFNAAGEHVSFHALRWLLGTVGLNGSETVAVYAGETDHASNATLNDAWAVAGLLYLAGQRHVVVYTGALPDNATGGMARSMSRETVYAAAMRDPQIDFGTSAAPLRDQLIALAQSGGGASLIIAPGA